MNIEKIEEKIVNTLLVCLCLTWPIAVYIATENGRIRGIKHQKMEDTRENYENAMIEYVAIKKQAHQEHQEYQEHQEHQEKTKRNMK